MYPHPDAPNTGFLSDSEGQSFEPYCSERTKKRRWEQCPNAAGEASGHRDPRRQRIQSASIKRMESGASSVNVHPRERKERSAPVAFPSKNATADREHRDSPEHSSSHIRRHEAGRPVNHLSQGSRLASVKLLSSAKFRLRPVRTPSTSQSCSTPFHEFSLVSYKSYATIAFNLHEIHVEIENVGRTNS